MLKITSLKIHLAVASLLLVWGSSVLAYSFSPTNNAPKHDFFHNFSGSLLTELKQVKKDNKFGVMVFFSTSHCRFCRRMKATVFNQASVQKYFRSHFQLIELDIESDQQLTDVSGTTPSYIEYAKRNRVRLTPTITFLDHHGEHVHRHVGMIADPQEFIWLGEYVTSGQTRNQSFSTFKMNKRRRIAQ
ncbi:MAG: thioredoxin fold domain-containing protein [Cycloclasticus sp.]